jgi:phosphoglycerol transferase
MHASPASAGALLRLFSPPDRPFRPAKKLVLLTLAQYGLAVVLSVATLTAVLRLWEADLSVPFRNRGDAVLGQVWARTLVDHGWYLHNPDIGAPGQLDFNDFPVADSWHFLLMKLLGTILRKPAAVITYYFLLGFPLATVSTLYLLRRLGVSYGCSLLAALLFAFQPYHFFRGTGHLMLASYYCIPLAVLVGLWIFDAEATWSSSRWIFALMIGAITSSAGVYYAFFSCYFLALAGLAALWSNGQIRHLLRALALVAIITAGLIANFLPTIEYHSRHGSNPDVGRRFPGEAEMYGLKLVPLLLPVNGHRLGPLAEITRQYQHPLAAPLLHNENLNGPIGVAGACGFLILVIHVLVRRGSDPGATALDRLAAWNIFAILLGTMGGAGVIISFLGFPWIRAYNRISIFIALFALTALALTLDRLFNRCGQSPRARAVRLLLLATLLVLGLVDQTTEHFVPAYAKLADEVREIKAFVQSIEKQVPPRTVVFQLPYVPFLEHPSPVAMAHYDHCRAYLASTTLRWSFGAMPGRRADAVQKSISAMPAAEMIKKLCLAGFGGIWVDHNGYADRATSLCSELAALLQVAPMESSNGRWVFFDMAKFNATCRKSFRDEQWQQAQERTLNPVIPVWTGGFSFPSGVEPATLRCCSSRGRLELSNSSHRARKCCLTLTAQTWYPQPAHLVINGLGIAATHVVSSEPRKVTMSCVVPPGLHAITFDCDAAQAPPSEDPRDRVFVVSRFSIEDVD